MNILYVAPRYHTNQVPIMKGWCEKKVNVEFMVRDRGFIESHDYVRLYKLKESFLSIILNYFLSLLNKNNKESKRFFFPDFLSVFREIRAFSPDLVILRNYSATNYPVVLSCHLLHVNRIAMYVQEPIYGENRKISTIERIKYLFFPSVVFSPIPYNGDYRRCDNKTFKNKWFIPLICNSVVGKRSSYFHNGKINLISIGKYREYKNHYLLVDAISKINKPEKWTFTILGQLSNQEENEYFIRLQRYINEKGLSERIILMNNIPFYEINSFLQRYDLFVLCSKEPANISLMEAMSNGLCPLSSIYNGTASYLDMYDCGIVFNTNCEDLSCALNGLANKPECIIELGLKAQNVIKEHFSFNNYLY